MTIYSVYNEETGYSETFYKLTDAKKAMKAHNAKGSKTKVYANGDWEPAGEIVLKGSNAYQMSNQTTKSYN